MAYRKLVSHFHLQRAHDGESMKTLYLVLLLTFCSFGKTSLWKISDGKNSLYLGGTIHLLRSTDYPLPSEFDSAYTKSETLIFETDLSQMNTPEFQQSIMKAVTYSGDTTLQQKLRPEIYARITTFLSAKGIPTHSLDMFRPSMISILLTQWEMAKYEMAEEGVDLHFFKKASTDKKKVVGLESTDEQIHYIATLGEDDPNSLLLNTIDEMSTLASTINTMIEAWKTGDEQNLSELIVKEMKESYPSVYQSLLVQRNKNWQPEIIKLITTKETEFILVGAGHLVGKDGLLESLRTEGYTVEQVQFKGDTK